MTETVTSLERVSPQTAAAAIEAGGASLLDVRTPGEFAAVHATPARLMPLDTLDPPTVMRQAAPDATVYVICKSGKRATTAALKLIAAGMTNVAVVEGGTDAWVAAGLPVVRGRGVISLERQVRIAAGMLALAGGILALSVHVGFAAIPALVGAGLVFAGVTDTCGMALLLARMPWNRGMKPVCKNAVRP